MMNRSKVARASYSADDGFTYTAVVTQIHPCRTKFEVRLVLSSVQRSCEISMSCVDNVDRLAPDSRLWVIPTCRLSSHLRCRDALSVLQLASKVSVIHNVVDLVLNVF